MYGPNDAAGFFMATLGAVVVLFLYRMVVGTLDGATRVTSRRWWMETRAPFSDPQVGQRRTKGCRLQN